MTNQFSTRMSRSVRLLLCFCLALFVGQSVLFASSHREAPLISLDPFADNTDLYAFRSPDNPDMITIIASYVPFQLPQGGPNWYGFSDNVRYEIHIDNNADSYGDEIIYYLSFQRENEDPSTFFNIRLGAQNIKTTYTLERSMDGGLTFETILDGGVVPPPNVGPRSIESGVGLGTTYEELISSAIATTSTGERVFCGPSDDPFFVDLGGIFDLGNSPRQDGDARDGVACFNVSTIALQIPISTLLKEGASSSPNNILDPDYVIGVWASASRKQIKTLMGDGPGANYDGPWVQVSRIGMPLTNEAVVSIGYKDYWNSISPYAEITDDLLDKFFYNPELALYMDDDQFGGAVPAFSQLRIQRNSLGGFDFGNGQDGLFALKGDPAVAGTALDDAIFGNLLLPGPGLPRSVDLWPIFHTGAPNFPPYQLATGKAGNPLAAGKPFISNFLPNGGDMLRLNMAVPPTDRNSAEFSSLGLVNSAVLGLTDPRFNATSDIQFIPNMDGFPNGRRLEDDVTRIELQAVSGVVLAAIGLWYDDYIPGDSPVTQDLLDVLTYSTGVEKNDLAFKSSFPYVASPFAATGDCGGKLVNMDPDPDPMTGADLELKISAPKEDYRIYETVPFTITLMNNGPESSSNISVSAALPNGLVFASSNASAGDYDPFTGIWQIPILASGETATLNQVLFTISSGDAISNFVQVISSGRADSDSTPNNNSDMIPVEDDEAAFELNITSADANVGAQLFASSNTQGLMGVFNIYEDDAVDMKAKEVLAMDADGIAYNTSTDRLIQLNRTDNRIDVYQDVNANLNNSADLNLNTSSSSDFINGREIAVSGNNIIVAQDANDANTQQNAFVVYTMSSNGIQLSKTHEVSINLWGIHQSESNLFAIIDNSNQLAEFNDFINQENGPIAPTKTIEIEGIVRTHGLTYIAEKDMMILTDVGDAGSEIDGAIVIVKNYANASSDGLVSIDEQIKISGSNTFLGNPVDVAYDNLRDRIFVAERKNEGGRILGFAMPVNSDNVYPVYNQIFKGASAVYFSNWDGNGKPGKNAQAFEDIDLFGETQKDRKSSLRVGTIYPVPAINEITATLDADFSGMVNLIIYNAQGKAISSISHEMFEGTNKLQFDISDYPAGYYYIKVLDSKTKMFNTDLDSSSRFLKVR